MPRIAVVLFLCGLTKTFTCLSQDNLVLNGGFELLTECPKEVSSLAKIGTHLSSPTLGTTDIFGACSTGKVAIPKNFRGHQDAFLGEAYAGLYLYSPNNYREYIQLKLGTQLEKDVLYELTFYVSLAESSTVSTNDINILFAEEPIRLGTSKHLSKSRLAQSTNHRFQFHKLKWKGSSRNYTEWTRLELRFKAKGFEKHIVLGNFNSDPMTSRHETDSFRSNTKEFAYYYMDEIRLVPSKRQGYEMGEPYVMEGVRFETDSYQLSELAKNKIKELYGNLKELPQKQITINGHTDDMGSEGHNEFLSHKRAKAVAAYLVELGFPQERIVWKGHGNRKPLISKITKEARLQNRRVDFVITDFEDQ